MGFSFEINHYSDSSIVSLQGKIMTDLDIDAVSTEISKLIENNKIKLIFNTEDLIYVNSSGINFFMRTLTKTRIQNGDLIFYGVNGNVDNIFKIAKINKIYTIYSSQQEALNHFKNK